MLYCAVSSDFLCTKLIDTFIITIIFLRWLTYDTMCVYSCNARRKARYIHAVKEDEQKSSKYKGCGLSWCMYKTSELNLSELNWGKMKQYF